MLKSGFFDRRDALADAPGGAGCPARRLAAVIFPGGGWGESRWLSQLRLRQHIWVYNSGINFEYSAYSPGWVLLAYLLQWANENHRERFDFMRGNEDYKYRFGG